MAMWLDPFWAKRGRVQGLDLMEELSESASLLWGFWANVQGVEAHLCLLPLEDVWID